MYEEERKDQQGTLNRSEGGNPYSNYSASYNNSKSSQQSYGAGKYSGANSYGTGSYRANSYSGSNYSGSNYGGNNAGGYSNYSYGQNSYSYNQGGQPGYGNYQYNSSNINPGVPPTPPKKKGNVGVKIFAAVCAVALLTGGVYFGYSALARRSGNTQQVQSENQATQSGQITANIDENTAESAKDSSAAAGSAPQIKTTTTTSGQTMAVVTDVTGVVAEVMPAMVIIHNNYTASASYFGYITKEEATASGSGIIVGENDKELLIATNYHVVEGADSLEVIFTDDTTVEAVVKGTDSGMDLAVIAVMLDDISNTTRNSIKVATLGDSNALTLGEPAIAIGNALGYGQSVTTGVISAINREVEMKEGVTQTFIQTDAAINPGNSGGALLNLKGEVIGINSNKIGGEEVEGMGYAIPISDAQPIIDKLMNEVTRVKVSSADRGYVGISGVSVTTDVATAYGIPQGVYVAEITRGGGAEAAGLKKGDVITRFDGNEITSMDDLQTRLQYYAAGTDVTITVKRQNGKVYNEYEYTITLGRGANSSSGADSNAADEGASGQYDGPRGSGNGEKDSEGTGENGGN